MMAPVSNDEHRFSNESDSSSVSCTSTLTGVSLETSESSVAESNNDTSTQQNIRVVTRIRPLSSKELNEQAKESLCANENSNKIEVNNREYGYDAVFGPLSSQTKVYEETAGDVIRKNLFKGFNVTVLAYGQTGSGKTHTMIGGSGEMIGKHLDETDGIIPRAVHDVFNHMKKLTCGSDRMSVSMSYFEIYNEEAKDLMSKEQDPPELTIRDNGGDTIVQNLSEHKVASPEEVASYMQIANEKRSTASTLMNAVSSRSHAICTLYINIAPMEDCADEEEEITAKLTLVDLAGSERAKKTGAEGNRLKEGININKGLFVLGQVVSALAELSHHSENSDKSSTHIKYRDSKLTRLLQSSLGGNSKTVMVACVSPADSNIDESVNTLRYAERTRSIKNTAVRNVVAAALSPSEAAALRRENQMLKLKLFQAEAKMTSMRSMGTDPSSQTNLTSLSSSNLASFCPTNSTVISGPTNIVNEELNGLDMRRLDIVTKLKVHCTSLEEKLDQVQSKSKLATGDSLEAVLRADRWKIQCEHLTELLKKNGISPEKNRSDEDLEKMKIVEELRQEIAHLKEKVNKSEIDAEVSRAIAASFVDGNGNVETAEKMVWAANSNIVEENDAKSDATESLSAELVAMSGSIEQKEQMFLQINKERECMEAMRSHFEDAMNCLQNEVKALSDERDKLMNRSVSNQNDTQSERLTLRTTMLEARIKELKRKTSEHEKSLRMQTQTERKCDRLEAELKADKKRRADLQKKLKELSTEHRNEQKKARMNATKLLRDSQRLKLELTKVKEAAARQESVLKRKAAEAINRQKVLAERTKKRARPSGGGKSEISPRRKDEINNFVERELGNALSLEDLQCQIDDSTELLQSAEERRQIIISQQTNNEDVTVIRALDSEIELRSGIVEQLEQNMKEIYKSGNRNPNTGEKAAIPFLDLQFWKALSRSELRYISQIFFSKLSGTQHDLELLKNDQESKIKSTISRVIKKQKREKEKEMMALKVHHAADIARLLESTKSTIERNVEEKISTIASARQSSPGSDTKASIDKLLGDYLETYSAIGAKVQSDLESIKTSQDRMKSVADEIITQNEAKAMLLMKTKTKKKKVTEEVELEPDDIFESEEENDDGAVDDGDDSDWAPDSPLRCKKKPRLTVETTMHDILVREKNMEEKKNEEFEKMTVVQLKALLRENGLTVSGKKAELIQRLTFNKKARDVVTASARKRQRVATPISDSDMTVASKKLKLSSPASPARKISPSSFSSKKSARKLTAATQASILRRRRSPRIRVETRTTSPTPASDNLTRSKTEDVMAPVSNTSRGIRAYNESVSSVEGVKKDKKLKSSSTRETESGACVSSDSASQIQSGGEKENTSPPMSTAFAPTSARINSLAQKQMEATQMQSPTKTIKKQKKSSRILVARSTNSAKKRRDHRRKNMTKSVSKALAQLEVLQNSL